MNNIKLPNFLIVGAAKSGTTSLYQYISQHPDVFMPANKEPNFFVSNYQNKTSIECPSYTADRRRMIFDENAYRALFYGANRYKAVGEATVTYLYKPEEAIPRIQALLGDPKILIILRNPIHRAFSHYSYCRELGFENLDFPEAISAEVKRLASGWSSTFAYIDQSRFSKQIASYKDSFSNVKIIILEEFIGNEQSHLNEIYKFLHIDDSFINTFDETFNSSGIPRFQKLQQLLVHENPIKQILKKLLSPLLGEDNLRAMNRHARKLNQGKKLTLSDEERTILKEILNDEIIGVESNLKRTIPSWHTK